MITSIRTATGLLCRAAPLSLLLACATLNAAPPTPLSLDGGAEVPRVQTSATANGTITVDTGHIVSGWITARGMKPTMAHIHLAAAGKNGPPIVTLLKSGEATFVVPDGTKLTDAQYASYLQGDLYVNVHSAAHPDGEIRAQLSGR